jgi:hypothetical protein
MITYKKEMEKRSANRKACNLEANIVSGGITCQGFIENVSENGMEYLMTSEIISSKNFTPDKRIELNFRIPSGEELKLDCEVRWFLRVTPEQNRLVLGMRIIDPPLEYKKFIRALSPE